MRFCPNKCLNFLGLILFFFSFSQRLSANGIEEQLNLLSLEEKESLEYFFSHAIKKDHLGHVLFCSNKPACLLGECVSGKQTQKSKLFIKGWNVWKEKGQLFPHPNFIIYNETVGLTNGDTAIHIYFINKKTLTELWTKNENALKAILGENFSIDSFIKSLEGKKNCSLFKADQTLMGFLLGYGIESSLAFKQLKKEKVILCSQEGKFNIEETKSDCGKALVYVLDDKANVLPVTFFGDPHSKEVILLQEKYANELEKIEAIFQKNDLLKISLQALCKE